MITLAHITAMDAATLVGVFLLGTVCGLLVRERIVAARAARRR